MHMHTWNSRSKKLSVIKTPKYVHTLGVLPHQLIISVVLTLMNGVFTHFTKYSVWWTLTDFVMYHTNRLLVCH